VRNNVPREQDSAADARRNQQSHALLSNAWRLHQAGSFADAERTYREVLSINPNQPDALNLLGLLAYQHGRMGEAAHLFENAARAAPTNADVRSNQGLALKALGRLDEALQAFDQAIATRPEFAEAHVNRGIALKELGRIDEALGSYGRAIALKPGLAMAFYNRAIALQEMRRYESALADYDQAISLHPAHAGAHANRGYVLRELGRLGEALNAYDRAIALRPDQADVHSARGGVLAALKRLDEAVTAHDRAIALRPGYAEAHTSRGLVLQEAGRLEAALASHDRAVVLGPGIPAAHFIRGLVLQELGRLEDAADSFATALALDPDYGQAAVAVPHLHSRLCIWADLAGATDRIARMLARGVGGINPFPLLALRGLDAVQHRDAARGYAEYLNGTLDRPPLVDPRSYRTRQRLRIGYLSADIYDHATVHLLAGVLEAHDRREFEVSMFSYGPEHLDDYRLRVQQSCEHFFDLRTDSDASAASRIAAEEIDILVDLKGFTQGFRMNLSALRPAPIIVSWLGYPGTLGHPRLADYIIGDPVVTPLTHADHFSETLALMPHCYQPNDRRRPIGPSPTRIEAGLPEHGFVFCSFNQCHKINPESFGLWCRLLETVPGSVLWLLQPNATAIAHLHAEARSRGVDPARLIFAPLVPVPEHLARLQLADLALDTFPYSSHTTGSDALWAGVPLVTRIGETFASRVAASLLSAIGLPQLVVKSDAEYLDLATQLALAPERLIALRERLAVQRDVAPLFDTQCFVRDLERLYAAIWAQQAVAARAPIVISAPAGETGSTVNPPAHPPV